MKTIQPENWKIMRANLVEANGELVNEEIKEWHKEIRKV